MDLSEMVEGISIDELIRTRPARKAEEARRHKELLDRLHKMTALVYSDGYIDIMDEAARDGDASPVDTLVNETPVQTLARFHWDGGPQGHGVETANGWAEVWDLCAD
jgi:hypothetical protein